jgi:hypothetical protein
MRLLRYTKTGLLERTKEGRRWECRVTTRGEERLMHLWRIGGLLDPQKTKTNLEKQEIATLLEIEQIVLERDERGLRRVELAYPRVRLALPSSSMGSSGVVGMING